MKARVGRCRGPDRGTALKMVSAKRGSRGIGEGVAVSDA